MFFCLKSLLKGDISSHSQRIVLLELWRENWRKQLNLEIAWDSQQSFVLDCGSKKHRRFGWEACALFTWESVSVQNSPFRQVTRMPKAMSTLASPSQRHFDVFFSICSHDSFHGISLQAVLCGFPWGFWLKTWKVAARSRREKSGQVGPERSGLSR